MIDVHKESQWLRDMDLIARWRAHTGLRSPELAPPSVDENDEPIEAWRWWEGIAPSSDLRTEGDDIKTERALTRARQLNDHLERLRREGYKISCAVCDFVVDRLGPQRLRKEDVAEQVGLAFADPKVVDVWRAHGNATAFATKHGRTLVDRTVALWFR